MQQSPGSACLSTPLSKTCTCTGPACCVFKTVDPAAVDIFRRLEVLGAHRKRSQQSADDCTKCIASFLLRGLLNIICEIVIKYRT